MTWSAWPWRLLDVWMGFLGVSGAAGFRPNVFEHTMLAPSCRLFLAAPAPRSASLAGRASSARRPRAFFGSYSAQSRSRVWCVSRTLLGVDVVKQKYPQPAKNVQEYRRNLSAVDGKKGYFFSKMPDIDQLLSFEPKEPEPLSFELQVRRLAFMAEVASNTLKIISGGPKFDDPDKDLVETTRAVMESGNEGRIVGRQLWGRPIEEALRLNMSVVELMRNPQYGRPLTEPRFAGYGN